MPKLFKSDDNKFSHPTWLTRSKVKAVRGQSSVGLSAVINITKYFIVFLVGELFSVVDKSQFVDTGAHNRNQIERVTAW